MKMPVPLVRLRSMTLKQAAIEQDSVAVDLNEVLSTRDRLGSAAESDLHEWISTLQGRELSKIFRVHLLQPDNPDIGPPRAQECIVQRLAVFFEPKVNALQSLLTARMWTGRIGVDRVWRHSMLQTTATVGFVHKIEFGLGGTKMAVGNTGHSSGPQARCGSISACGHK
jgi:hypothetical protein